jgi:hypothetical protein
MSKRKLSSVELRLGNRWLVSNPKRGMQIKQDYGEDGAKFAAAAMAWLVLASLFGVCGAILLIVDARHRLGQVIGFPLLLISAICLAGCVFRLRIANQIKNELQEDSGDTDDWDGHFGF